MYLDNRSRRNGSTGAEDPVLTAASLIPTNNRDVAARETEVLYSLEGEVIVGNRFAQI
jgi:hypothetical protein